MVKLTTTGRQAITAGCLKKNVKIGVLICKYKNILKIIVDSSFENESVFNLLAL